MGGQPAVFAGFKVTHDALAEYAHTHNLKASYGSYSAVVKSLSKKIGVPLAVVVIDDEGMGNDEDEPADEDETVWLCVYAEDNLGNVRDLDVISQAPMPEAFVARIPELIETVDGHPRRMVSRSADAYGHLPVCGDLSIPHCTETSLRNSSLGPLETTMKMRRSQTASDRSQC